MKKIVLLVLLITLTTGTLTGCSLLDFNENKVSDRISKDVQNLNPITEGEYVVLDIREQIGGNNLRAYCFLTIVLQDMNGNRFYYEYLSYDKKSAEYICLGKFVPGDKVTYKNNTFSLNNEDVKETN